jgi:hypothetical protein
VTAFDVLVRWSDGAAGITGWGAFWMLLFLLVLLGRRPS